MTAELWPIPIVLLAGLLLTTMRLARRSGDLFHPALLFAAIAGMMYVAMPTWLLVASYAEVERFLSAERIWTVLWVNLFVLAGCLAGFWLASRPFSRMPTFALAGPAGVRDAEGRLLWAAGLLLVLGSVGYVTNLADYGFAALLEVDPETYAEERPTGYLGELAHALMPAAIAAGLLSTRPRYRRAGFLMTAIAIAPWLLGAAAGGRRGPAAIGLLLALFVLYFWRPGRLKLRTFVGWVASLALVVTFLIANRGNLVERRYDQWNPLTEAIFLQPSEGHEFVFGGGAIIAKLENGDYFWGRRHVMTYVVRPVPRQLWPDKYEEAAGWLGLPNWVEANSAVFDRAAVFVLGWAPPLGAAPGLVADLWIDFGPLSPLVGGLMTYGLVLLWGRARLGHIRETILYGLAFALMVYVITQGVSAFLVRFLFTSVVVLLVAGILRLERKSRGGPVAALRAAAPRPGVRAVTLASSRGLGVR